MIRTFEFDDIAAVDASLKIYADIIRQCIYLLMKSL